MGYICLNLKLRIMNTELPAHATITYHFSVSAEDVFDAWLDTFMIGRFMFGPDVRDEKIVSLSNEAKKGGAFSFVVEREGMQIDHIGEYLEIERPLRLVFTWAIKQDLPDNSRVVIDIIPTPTGTELTLTHEMPSEWEHFIEGSKTSWMKMLTALDKIL
jgi:uncharacterized protein YndB with AHSA1/START domain